MKRAEPKAEGGGAAHEAALHARRIVRIYELLARNDRHLLAPILGRAAPKQWSHYPRGDAIDARRRYQWYYHSHSPADRPGCIEHGHFHLFARTDARRSPIDPEAESAFLKRLGGGESRAKTRHLLAIGMNSVGVPISLFTVNRWVTGDQLLSSAGSLRLLESLAIDSGHPQIDRFIASLIHLHRPQIRKLFRARDQSLLSRARRGPGTLDDESCELLSEVKIDLDRRIATVCRRAAAR